MQESGNACRREIDFLVITLKTDEGIEGTSFVFAGLGGEMAGQIAASARKPLFLGKDPLAREKPRMEFRDCDRWWNHVPIYAYSPTEAPWKGGVTPVMKTAHLAESFGVQCEVHTSIYHPLEIVDLHCCCAISNCEFFEVLYPMSYMDFGMKKQLDIDSEGYAHPPQAPGIGVDFDWDFIDGCTIQKL